MQNSMLAYYCIGTTCFSNNDCLSLLTMLESSILLLTLSGILHDTLSTDQFFQIAAIINFALKSKILTDRRKKHPSKTPKPKQPPTKKNPHQTTLPRQKDVWNQDAWLLKIFQTYFSTYCNGLFLKSVFWTLHLGATRTILRAIQSCSTTIT